MDTRILAYFIFIFTKISLNASGVIAYKAHYYHPDVSANIVLYRDLAEAPGRITIKTSDKAFTIERSQFVAKVDVITSIPANIID